MGAMPALPVAPVVPPVPPAGPVEAIGQSLAASMPTPVAEPAPRFPDQKPGATVLLGSPEGANENAVFLRETPAGALVRIQGQEVELTPEAFDAARNQAEVNQNREETPRGDLGGNSVAASVGAKKRTPIALSVEEEFARLDPEQARKRLDGLTAQAKQRGWDARRRNLRTILEGRMALGGPANVEPTSAEDGPEGGPAPAGVDDVRSDSG